MTFLDDLGTGVLATIFGILLVYIAFRPRIKFEKVIRYSGTPESYRFRYRNVGFLPAIDLRLSAAVLLKAPGTDRWLTIPIPITTDQLIVLRPNIVIKNNLIRKTLRRAFPRMALPRKDHYWQAPRLLLDQVDWKLRLPDSVPAPQNGEDLRDILAAYEGYGANFRVDMIATSSVFAVAGVLRRNYGSKNFAPSTIR